MARAIIYVFRDYDDEGHPLYYADVIDCDPAPGGEDNVLARTDKHRTPPLAIAEATDIVERREIEIDSVVRRDLGQS